LGKIIGRGIKHRRKKKKIEEAILAEGESEKAIQAS